MEKYIDPQTKKWIVTVPKLKPKWVEILMHVIATRDPNIDPKRAIEIIGEEWKGFVEKGKERAPRKPKEKVVEPKAPEPTEEPQQQGVDMTTFSRFLRREFPSLDKDQWKTSRHSRPRIRLLQNVSSIDKVFRKCKLFPRSQPYRALHEIRKTLEEIIDNIPQSEEIVQKKIVENVDSNEAIFDYDEHMMCNDDEIVLNDPPPPTPPSRNREENVEEDEEGEDGRINEKLTFESFGYL